LRIYFIDYEYNMTIVIQNIEYNLHQFLFKEVKLTNKSASLGFATDFLTLWISGGKQFEMTTSGSTGVPKKIILKRKWLETSALQTVNLLSLWDEKVFCCIPVNKIGGLMMIVRSLAGGFDIEIVEPSANPMLQLSDKHDYTFISLVPYQLSKILEDKESTIKLNRFKNILLGGASLNENLLNVIESLEPAIYHTYGMTETCSHIALKKLNHGKMPHFKPNPDVDFRTDSQGLLSVRGFQTGNEWVDTKDIIYMYPDGTFDFLGRSDFMINSGGFKVFPEALEINISKILKQHGIESELVISSKEHVELGEQVVLVIHNSVSQSSETLLNLLRPKLEKYELPKLVHKLSSFPVNDGGKIDRKAIRAILKQEFVDGLNS
jgi:O-succinylbenzoic acid--CoA ligase